MTNEELVEKIRSGENVEENTNRLYLQNERLIGKIASMYVQYDDIEDLKQEGYFGFVTALDLWSPEGGANFASYAYQWIRQAIRKYLVECGSLVRLPSSRRERISKYKKAVEELRQMFGRDPSSLELAVFLEVSPNEINKIKNDAQFLEIRSTNEILNDEGFTLEDTIEDKRDQIGDLLDDIEKNELSSLLWSLVDDLKENESDVLRKRYKEGLTLRECGLNLGITPESVRQIESKAIRKMRDPSVKKKLRPFVEDRLSSVAYNTTGLGIFTRTWTSAPERAVILLEEGRQRLEERQKAIF